MKNLVKKAEKRDFWRAAKRVMIVGIMVIGFIMPAQVSAQKADRGEKGRQEFVQKKGDKKIEKKAEKREKKENAKNSKKILKQNKKAHKQILKQNKKAHKHNAVVKHHHHNKHVAVHHKKPVVIHHHDNVVHHHCNGVAEAATAVIGLAALVALIAN